MRVLSGVDPEGEAEALRKRQEEHRAVMSRLAIRVTNPNLDGRSIEGIPGLQSFGVTISRHRRGDEVKIASHDTLLQVGDHLLVVGEPNKLEEFRIVVGEPAEVSFEDSHHRLEAQRMLISSKQVAGRSVRDLHLASRFGVQVTRIVRSGIELPPARGISLQLGDQLQVVGTTAHLREVAKLVGDSPRSLWQPDLIPIFVGIAIGIMLGSLPITIPLLGITIKLGLAGGVLITAIVLSNLHRVGPLVWFLKPSAGFLMREIGIALFLASVGLRSGDRFVETLVQGEGLWWMASGIVITIVPLALTGWVGMRLMGVPYLTMSGLIAGGMTAPAALAFANRQASSDLQNLAYATVFPLTMIARILCAQVLVVIYLHG